jgi:hypothetical protein
MEKKALTYTLEIEHTLTPSHNFDCECVLRRIADSPADRRMLFGPSQAHEVFQDPHCALKFRTWVMISEWPAETLSSPSMPR